MAAMTSGENHLYILSRDNSAFDKNLFACLQEVAGSLRLLSVAICGLQMMMYFS